MAKLRFFNNIFENDYKEYEFDFSRPLSEQIEQYINVTEYKDYLVECYDPETEKTFFAPLEDDIETPCISIVVDGIEKDLDYVPKDFEVVQVMFLPLADNWGWGGAFIGMAIGALALGVSALVTGGWSLAVLGAAGWGGALGFLAGGLIAPSLRKGESAIEYGEDGKSSPDVRGASNESLLNSPYPFTIGKHLITPKIIGDPYTTYSGTKGEDAYVNICYCAGYSPVKLTDFKLGDFILAYNRNANTNHMTLLNGKLKGCANDGSDSGDILDRWNNNDIEIELIQQKNGGNNFGTIYPDKVSDQEINANVLYVADGSLNEAVEVVYKDTPFPNKFRTNGVWFTESCPSEFTITLDLPKGAYSSHTNVSSDKNNSTSSTVKESIPLWFAIQWRMYSKNNASSQSDGSDYGLWNNITVWNNTDFGATYNKAALEADIAAHKGNTLNIDELIKTDNKELFNKDDLFDKYMALSDTAKSYQSTSLKLIKGEKRDYIKFGNHSWWDGTKKSFNKWNDRYYIGFLTSSGSNDSGFVMYDSKNKTLYLDVCPVEDEIPLGEKIIDRTILDYSLGEFERMSTKVDKTVTLYNCKKINQYDSSLPLRQSESAMYNLEVKNICTCGNSKSDNYYLAEYYQTPSVSEGWYNKVLCNFESITGENGKSEIRLSSTVTLTEEQMKQAVSDENSIKSIEVRVVRVSPCYLDMTSGTTNNPAYSYTDNLKVLSLVTKSFNEDKYLSEGVFENVKVAKKEDLGKFCYIQLKAKADKAGYIASQLDKLNCISESFSPIWDETDYKFYPENVTRISKYYGYYTDATYTYKSNRTKTAVSKEITKEEYIQGRQEGYNWIEDKCGSNFSDLIKDEVLRTYLYTSGEGSEIKYYKEPEFTTQVTPSVSLQNIEGTNIYYYNGSVENHNDIPCLWLSDYVSKYNNNSVSSGFLLAAVGAQNGRIGLGYENINMLSIQEWYEDTKDVTDGSTYSSDDGGHSAGELIHLSFTANGYVYESITLEELLKKLAIAGRAVVTYDDLGRLKVVMDKKVNYPVGTISSQNCISSSNSYNYSELPAGLRVDFDDENDGYERNGLYCWSDGFKASDYHGEVQSYKFDFVTSPEQNWSLGRYVLACQNLNREVITKKIGAEGKMYSLGDVLMVNGDDLLIGDGSGRIQEVIEDSNGTIYGFVSDTPFEYKGEDEGSGLSTQGVMIMQPKKLGDKRVVTLRLSAPNTIYMYQETPSLRRTILKDQYEQLSASNKRKVRIYDMSVGLTNVVIFENSVSRDTSSDPYGVSSYNFTTGDQCLYGIYTKIASKYRITKIKPEKGGLITYIMINYTDDLYNYGAALPSFQNNMTVPSPVADPISLSEYISEAQLNVAINQSNGTLLERINEIYSNHIITLYKRSNLQETTTGITLDSYYDFSENTFKWEGDVTNDNGWYFKKEDAEASGDGTVFITTATAYGRDTVDTIDNSEWAEPIALGLNGVNGYNTYSLHLYKQSLNKPEEIPTDVTYTFSQNKITCNNFNGWSDSLPSLENDDRPVWDIHATALSTTDTDIIHSGSTWSESEWSEPTMVISKGYTQSEIMSWITQVNNETPNIQVIPDTVQFGSDSKGIIPVAQSRQVTVKVLQNGKYLPFTIGTISGIPKDNGVDCVTVNYIETSDNGKVLIFTAKAGMQFVNCNIVIQLGIIASSTEQYFIETTDLVWNENTETWERGPGSIDNYIISVTDDTNNFYGNINSILNIPQNASEGEYFLWTGEYTPASTELVEKGAFFENTYYSYTGSSWKESEINILGQLLDNTIVDTYEMQVSLDVVQGGSYAGRITSIDDIPTNPIYDDYFTWGGIDGTQFVVSATSTVTLLQGCLYHWDGETWLKDNNVNHNAYAMYDIFQSTDELIKKNNSNVTAWFNRVISNSIATESITVTGTAIINAMAVAQVVLGTENDKNAFIQSYGYESGSKGFKISATGEAEFNQLKVGGATLPSQGDIQALQTNVENLSNAYDTLTNTVNTEKTKTQTLLNNTTVVKHERSTTVSGLKTDKITLCDAYGNPTGTTWDSVEDTDNGLMVFGYNKGDGFELLSSRPSDWSNNYSSYFVKNDKGIYISNTSSTWTTGTYYKRNADKSQFIVSTDGLLEANNAIIWGTIYATDGVFAGELKSATGTFNGTVLIGDYDPVKGHGVKIYTGAGSGIIDCQVLHVNSVSSFSQNTYERNSININSEVISINSVITFGSRHIYKYPSHISIYNLYNIFFDLRELTESRYLTVNGYFSYTYTSSPYYVQMLDMRVTLQSDTFILYITGINSNYEIITYVINITSTNIILKDIDGVAVSYSIPYFTFSYLD